MYADNAPSAPSAADNALSAPSAPLDPRASSSLLQYTSVDISRPPRLYPFSSVHITGRSSSRERRRLAKLAASS